MKNNDELKGIDIKNCLRYCFSEIIKIEEFDFDILVDCADCSRLHPGARGVLLTSQLTWIAA